MSANQSIVSEFGTGKARSGVKKKFQTKKPQTMSAYHLSANH